MTMTEEGREIRLQTVQEIEDKEPLISIIFASTGMVAGLAAAAAATPVVGFGVGIVGIIGGVYASKALANKAISYWQSQDLDESKDQVKSLAEDNPSKNNQKDANNH